MTSTNKSVRKSVYNSVLYFINDSVCKSVNAPTRDYVNCYVRTSVYFVCNASTPVEQKLNDYDFRTKD